MSTRQRTDYSATKKAVRDVCEHTFSNFNAGYISVPEKSCQEVHKLLEYACNENPMTTGIDIDKYVYIASVNGMTIVKV